jgi:hypothetical protein
MMPHVEEEPSKCDFCSILYAPHYEAAGVFEAIPGETRIPLWTSCDTCHDFITRRRWTALRKRAVGHMVTIYPDLPRERIEAAIKLLHDNYRRHRSPNV